MRKCSLFFCRQKERIYQNYKFFTFFPTTYLIQKIHHHHISVPFLSTCSSTLFQDLPRIAEDCPKSGSPHQSSYHLQHAGNIAVETGVEEQQLSPLLHQTRNMQILQSFAPLFVAFGGLHIFIVVLQSGFVMFKEKKDVAYFPSQFLFTEGI